MTEILTAAQKVSELKEEIIEDLDLADNVTGEYHLCCQAINDLDNAIHKLRHAQLIHGDRIRWRNLS